MKRNIMILLTAIVISFAWMNSYNGPNDSNNYSMNQLGGYLIYEGISGESSATTSLGEWFAAAGGGALVNSVGLATGAAWAIGSNPVGWAIGGACAIL
ncbi:MAG: hypothetical protein LBE91_01310 [Tannerella sp.]|jgi:hypothetical protein|nr:hypothetical protein [Tannerella sp.]